jgi:hypothetical protein
VFKRVRQGVRASAFLAPAISAIRADGSTLVLVVGLAAVLVILMVVWACIWPSDADRRKDARKVLESLLRWKGGDG